MEFGSSERTYTSISGESPYAGANNPARAASETTERELSGEPANSTIRGALLAFAGLSILGSLALQFTGRKAEALFVGQWPPTLVAIALWYQIVKSERGGPASQAAGM